MSAKILQFIIQRVVIVLLDWAIDYLPAALKKWLESKKRDKEQDLSEKKTDEILQDPTKTPEERAIAYQDHLNSGR